MPQPQDNPAPVQPPRRRSASQRLLLLLKLAVTLGLCAWIALHVQWRLVGEELRRASLGLVLFVYFLYVGSIVLSAFKWQQLLAVHEISYRLRSLTRWYIAAFFLNHFLPTSIGGDGYRIYKTWRNPRHRACALLAVFAERASGIAALMLLGYAASAVVYIRLGDRFAGLFLLLGTIGLAIGVLGLLTLFMLDRSGRIGRITDSPYCPSPLAAIIRLADDFRGQPRRIVGIGALSFLFHATRISLFWLMILAFGVRADPLELTLVIALTELVGLLPISLGGLGLVDGAFIFLMARYGLSQEVALSAMLLLRLPRIPLSLLGAYFYFTGGHARAAAEPPAPDSHFNRPHCFLEHNPAEASSS